MDEQPLVRFAVLVTGSRDWKLNQTALAEFDALDWDASEVLQVAPSQRLLIHGGADGADQLIAQAARAENWQVREVRPDYGRYPKRVAPLRRNDLMVKQLVELRSSGVPIRMLALWRDHSGGTGYTIDRAREASIDPVIAYDCSCHPNTYYPNSGNRGR